MNSWLCPLFIPNQFVVDIELLKLFPLSYFYFIEAGRFVVEVLWRTIEDFVKQSLVSYNLKKNILLSDWNTKAT